MSKQGGVLQMPKTTREELTDVCRTLVAWWHDPHGYTGTLMQAVEKAEAALAKIDGIEDGGPDAA